MKSNLTHIFSCIFRSHNETGKRPLRLAVDQQHTRNRASDAQETSTHLPPPISPQDPIFLVETRVGVGFAAHQASHPTTHPARILLPLLVGIRGGYLAPHQYTHLSFFSRRKVFCLPGSWAHSKEQPHGRAGSAETAHRPAEGISLPRANKTSDMPGTVPFTPVVEAQLLTTPPFTPQRASV